MSAKNTIRLSFLKGMPPLLVRAAFFTIALAVPGKGVAELVRSVSPETGIVSWTWSDRGVSVQFVQRRPNQTRGFFIARGFTTEQTKIIARACVFQSIVRNDGSSRIELDLRDWQVTYGDKVSAPVTREDWGGRWRTAEVGDAPRIALNWALLPTRQVFEPGDYNWGMISFGPPPGESFDLRIGFIRDGNTVWMAVSGVFCAAQPRE